LSLSFWLSHQCPICIALLPHLCYMLSDARWTDDNSWTRYTFSTTWCRRTNCLAPVPQCRATSSSVPTPPEFTVYKHIFFWAAYDLFLAGDIPTINILSSVWPPFTVQTCSALSFSIRKASTVLNTKQNTTSSEDCRLNNCFIRYALLPRRCRMQCWHISLMKPLQSLYLYGSFHLL
jgi:hypothetical protein